MIWYQIGLMLYKLGLIVASLFYKKAALILQGQKSTLTRFSSSPIPQNNLIWIHVASLGEFEQARPIIENIKKTYPKHYVLLSFFSSSGYEVRKNYALADEVIYLPMDSQKNATRFFEYYKPILCIVVKYEFWYYYFKESANRNIPLLSISTILRNNQVFFKRKNRYTQVLNFVDHFFVQNNESKQLLSSLNISENITVSGDTRFDRVAKVRQEEFNIDDIQEFCKGKTVVVYGSSWPEDLNTVQSFIKKTTTCKHIIAPHEISEEQLTSIEKRFPNNTSRYTQEIDHDKDILIIDCIGKLMGIYALADIAYVGGAFGSGLHNILEPATFGIPVVFGKEYSKFQEAIDLLKLGGAYSVGNADMAQKTLLELLNNEALRNKSGKICADYVDNNTGATKKIMTYINSKLASA